MAALIRQTNNGYELANRPRTHTHKEKDNNNNNNSKRGKKTYGGREERENKTTTN